MIAQIIPFDFEEQAVRVVMRAEDPWFVAADVCRVLEIANTTDAIKRLDDDEVTLDTIEGSHRPTNLINESGLYALVLTSRKEQARRFRKWITAEVLPAIRRDGRYEHGADPAPVDPGPARDGEFWLSMIREARLLGGTRAGRDMWARSPLPPLTVQSAVTAHPAEGRAVLDHLMRHPAVAPLLTAACDGDASAAEALAAHGLRLRPGGLIVANANHPGICAVFQGTAWAGGHHRAALLSLPGAQASSAVYSMRGVTCRGVLIPMPDCAGVAEHV